MLAAWLHGAKEIAVAVCNGYDPGKSMHLPLDSAGDTQRIPTG